MRSRLLWLLPCLVLLGCASASAPRTGTVTVDKQAAGRLDACVERAYSTTTPQCRVIMARAASKEIVIRCGGGVTTNGSCVFAGNLQRAYRSSGLHGQVALVVTGTRVACKLAAAGERCQSVGRNVWVQFAAP